MHCLSEQVLSPLALFIISPRTAEVFSFPYVRLSCTLLSSYWYGARLDCQEEELCTSHFPVFSHVSAFPPHIFASSVLC